MDKYKAGDKVVIKSKRPPRFNSYGAMDKWLGKVMTIVGFKDSRTGPGVKGYEMLEDEGTWYWDDEMINHKATKELKNVYKLLASDLKEGIEYLEEGHSDDILFSMRGDNLYYKIGDENWTQLKGVSLGEIFSMRFAEYPKFPRFNDVYYFVSMEPTVRAVKTRWANEKLDLDRQRANNIFKTKNEVDFKVSNIRRILAEPYSTGGKISNKLLVELFDNIQKI